MSTFMLTLSYDGSSFHGFQRQKKKEIPTVQGTLEEALCLVLQENIIVYGAGRTDAGVHARAQVAHIQTDCSISADSLMYALNRALPPSLVICHSELVDDSFHARKCAVGKWYSYRLFNGSLPPALGHQYFACVTQPLDEALFRQSLNQMIGNHWFKGFCGHGSSVKSYDRTLYLAKPLVDVHRQWWEIHFVGDGFLRKMVRNMVGTAIDVALHRKPLSCIDETIRSGDRRKAGKTAAPEGLTLEAVFYEQNQLEGVIRDLNAMDSPSNKVVPVY